MPVSCPATANRSWPSASISAARSPARVPVSYSSPGLPDSPQPRWSGTITVKSRASAGMTSRQAYQVWGQPCTSSNGGPSPPVTTCWRRSPVSTYRLMNVPVNPSGRCGAPATEPGPSGMPEEFMGVSFSRLAGQEVLRVGGAGELLADQPGQQQQCAPRPVVPYDVLRLPGGVALDHRDVADRLAADAGGVVLEPAVLAVRAGEVELLVVIEPAN